MTGSPPSIPNGPDLAALESVAPAARRSLITALVLLAALACAVLALLLLQASRSDPYTRATLERVGSAQDGGRLFRLN